MDRVVSKKTKSVKNAEKRRERSKVAARCRRGKESEIFTDLSLSLPITESAKSGLDKASVMRLTLCDLKLKRMMDTAFPQHDNLRGVVNQELDSQVDSAMGGFILVSDLDGDVVYASEGITTHLGICQYEIMGQSIFEFSHPCDHHDIRDLLTHKKDEEDLLHRSGLFRMKSTITSRGRNAHLRSGTFKVVNCIGRIFTGNEKNSSEKWFVCICEPLLHPSDVDIPLNKQTFLSKHTPDMKFEYVDESVIDVMGYKAEDMIGKPLFEFYHAMDGGGIAKSFKELYAKGQNQTERYRFLTKGGGWVWIITQATVIYGNNSSTPNSVVCIHFITSAREEEDSILSAVQMSDSTLPVPKTQPSARSILSESKSNVQANNVEAVAPGVKIEPVKNLYIEENDFISDLLVGPLLNNATCSTSKIFAPRTEDMDMGFLMPVDDDTLIVSKEEPVDLTHLAPIAGDGCISLDIPLLEDLLATLDEADMAYSFADPNSEEVLNLEPFQQNMFSSQSKVASVSASMSKEPGLPISPSPMLLPMDPSLANSPDSKSPLLSPFANADSSATSASAFISGMELSPPPPLSCIDDRLFQDQCHSPKLDALGFKDVPLMSPPLVSNTTVDIEITQTKPVQPEVPYADATTGDTWSDQIKIRNGTRVEKQDDNHLKNSPHLMNMTPEPPDGVSLISVLQKAARSVPEKRKQCDGDPNWYVLEGDGNIALGGGPSPNKMSKLVSVSAAGLLNGVLENKVAAKCSEPARIYILVPFATRRRASLGSTYSSTSNSGSDSDPSTPVQYEVIDDEYSSNDFNQILSKIGLVEMGRNSSSDANSGAIVKPLLASVCPKKVRKSNFTGSLLNDGPLSFNELTRQDCEVNAPLDMKSELLQGPELINALEMVFPSGENI